jgi:hypothetical protein
VREYGRWIEELGEAKEKERADHAVYRVQAAGKVIVNPKIEG